MRSASRIMAPLRSFMSNRLYQVSQPSFLSPIPQYHSKFYSSNPNSPNSVLQLITTKGWSDELANKLEKTHSQPLSHETVMYVLKNLESTPLKAFHFFNWVVDKHGFNPSLIVYSFMLRVLGNKGSMNEFWDLIKKMWKCKCEVDEETYLLVLGDFKKEKMTVEATRWIDFFSKVKNESVNYGIVKDVVDVVLKSDWNDNVEKKLGEIKFTLCDDIVLRIFKALRLHPWKALNFFRWVEKEMGYKHSVVTYNSILTILAREDLIEDFWSVVKELKMAGHYIDMDTYEKLSKQLRKNNMVEDALELYELMMDSPYPPSEGNCITLLRHFSLTGLSDQNLVPRVLDKYVATGRSLSKDMYNFYHRFWTSAGKIDEAEKVVDAMRNAGYQPDKVTYNQLVFGLCKAKRFEDARKKLDEMEALGCVPDVQTWTLLIQGHFSMGQADQALKCFANMVEKKVEGDGGLLHVMVVGLCGNNMLDNAYTFFTQNASHVNFRPWQATYVILIKNLLRERKLENSMNLLRSMKKLKVSPCFEPFADYISKFGTVDNAMELFEVLNLNHHYSSPSPAHFRVLQSFIKEGRESEARDLLCKCPEQVRNDAEVLNLFSSRRLVRSTA
ncbi:hypothetical protein ACHQM5_011016 [Ranunculus cassubicifolius]